MRLQTIATRVAWRGTWSPVDSADAALLAELPPLQRLLLTTDGTLTPMLATLLDEPVAVRVLGRSNTVTRLPDLELALFAGAHVLERRVLLSGARSGTPLLCSSSRIATDRLPRRVAEDLVAHDEAIGLVLRAHDVEIHRVPLRVGIGPASASAAAELGDIAVCHRRYTIRSGGRPIMVVDEQFPAAGFGPPD